MELEMSDRFIYNTNHTCITSDTRMATITVRIPDETKKTMDEMNEINWSSVIRNMLEAKVEEYYVRHRIAIAEKQIKEGKVTPHSEVKKRFLK